MAIELALIAPMLCLILAGLIDTSRLVVQSMQVHAAAQAGADYARAHADSFSAAAVQQAMQSATPLPVTATPAPSKAQACVSSGKIVESAQTTCASGGLAGQFVTVKAQATFKPLMPWPKVILPTTLQGQAMVRIS